MGESRNWGMGTRTPTTLEAVIRPLNPKTKQAMFAAANKGLIARRTWDGCAFNAGSLEVALDDASSVAKCGVSSTGSAAKLFNLDEHVVSNFIHVWDSLSGTDEEATQKLREAIETVGLFTEPNESSARQVLRTTIYKALEARKVENFVEEVESLSEVVAAGVATSEETDLWNEFEAAGQLLSAGV